MVTGIVREPDLQEKVLSATSSEPLLARARSGQESKVRARASRTSRGPVQNATMGVHHGLAQLVGGRTGIPHGLANAVILTHAVRFNAGDPALYERAHRAPRVP